MMSLVEVYRFHCLGFAATYWTIALCIPVIQCCYKHNLFLSGKIKKLIKPTLKNLVWLSILNLPNITNMSGLY